MVWPSLLFLRGLPQWLSSKEYACNAEATGATGQFLDQEDPLEEGMAAPSSILARRMPVDGGNSEVLSDFYSLK